MITVVIVPSRKSFVRDQIFLLFSMKFSEDDGSLARPPMRLFGRSTMSKGRSVESELSGSDDNGSDGSHASGVQWSGGEFGAFTAEDIAEENSDEDDGW
jgi:hypothetical protein